MDTKQITIFIVALSILGAIIGYNSAGFFSSGFQHTQTYFLTDPATDSRIITEIRSENFLQQEKARQFIDTSIAILSSSDFQNEVLMPGDSLVISKKAPQVLTITYASSRQDESFTNLQKVVNHFNLKISELDESTPTSKLKAVGTHTQPSFSAVNKSVLTLGGFFVGLIFGLFVIGTKNYFKV